MATRALLVLATGAWVGDCDSVGLGNVVCADGNVDDRALARMAFFSLGSRTNSLLNAVANNPVANVKLLLWCHLGQAWAPLEEEWKDEKKEIWMDCLRQKLCG